MNHRQIPMNGPSGRSDTIGRRLVTISPVLGACSALQASHESPGQAVHCALGTYVVPSSDTT